MLVSFKKISGRIKGENFIRDSSFKFYQPNFQDKASPYSLFSYDTTTNPILGGSYNLYIKPFLKKSKFNYFNDLIQGIKEKDLNVFSYTLMLYNANIGYAIVYTESFELTLMSTVTVNRFTQIFDPFVSQNVKKMIFLCVINVIYLLGFIYIVFLIARNFSHHILELIKSKKYSFEWTDWIDLIVIVFSLLLK